MPPPDPFAIAENLGSLLTIAIIVAATPLVLGVFKVRIAEVVVLLAAGAVCGPQLLNLIHVNDAILLFAEVGLGFLFFMAGLELEQKALRGQSGRLAVIGWGVSILLAGLAVGILEMLGMVRDFVGVAIALTSTALGTLLPVMRELGLLNKPFGVFFMGAGAVGEFGPVLAISVLLGAKSSLGALVSIVIFGALGILLAVLPRTVRSAKIRELLAPDKHTAAQESVRLMVLLLILLLTLAGQFGLDVVIGAFVAGIIVRRYLTGDSESVVQSKLEAMAFGLFIPLFFVVSGSTLDVRSIIEHPFRMSLFFVLIFVCRGLPQVFLYRRAIPDIRERWAFVLYVATGLPIIVAVTSVGLATGVMLPENAAALVGAGALTVLLFPLFAGILLRDKDRAPISA